MSRTEQMVEILCPECKKALYSINAAVMCRVCFPRVVCECGFDGPLEWINPDPAMAPSEHPELLPQAHHRIVPDSGNTSLHNERPGTLALYQH